MVRRLIDDKDIQSILDSVIDLLHKKDHRIDMVAVLDADGTMLDNVVWDGDEEGDADDRPGD